MKRILLVTIICFGIQTLNLAQNFTKSTSPYTAFNGRIFHVGDTIIIGSPGDFSNEYLYFTKGKDHAIRNKAEGVIKIGNQEKKYDMRYHAALIKHFKIYPGYGTCAVVENIFNNMININKALEIGELMSQEHIAAVTNKVPYLTDSIAYIEFLRRNDTTPTKDHAKEFLYLFQNKIYNQIREDEFEFNNKINLTQKILLNEIRQSYSDTFKICIPIEISNYEFDKNGFSLIWDNASTVHILTNILQILTPEDINKEHVKLTDLYLKFSNTEQFNFFSLFPDRANYLIKHRKEKNGDVDRKIWMYVHFTISDIENTKTGFYKYKFIDAEKCMNCKITKICLFEDKIGYNWLNTIKAN